MTKATGRRRGRPSENPPEIDDLIGDVGAPAPAELADEDEPFSLDIARVYGGVSATWLATVFGQDKNTVKKKLGLAGIESVGTRKGGLLYRIADAAPYLVPPKVDLMSYIKSLRPNDLPPILSDSYWSAMLKRQKWEENAGQLWRTENVLAVFGDLALEIKTTVSLWVEEIDRQEPLTAEQRALLVRMADKLLESVHERMVEAPNRGFTASAISEDPAVKTEAEPDAI